VRSDLVVPVLEPRQKGAEGTVPKRDELVREPFFLESADDALVRSSAYVVCVDIHLAKEAFG
jgi:hypothetical protein